MEELDWLAASRGHPVDQILTMGAALLPIIALGFSEWAIGVFATLHLWQSVLAHSNIRLGFGPLRFVFVSPEFHHWHHSNQHEARDRNFAAQLSFLDVLFGSSYLPRGQIPTTYGLDRPMPHVICVNCCIPSSASGSSPNRTQRRWPTRRARQRRRPVSITSVRNGSPCLHRLVCTSNDRFCSRRELKDLSFAGDEHEIATRADIKLDETDGVHGESMAVNLTVNRWLDRTARAAVAVVFVGLVIIGGAVIPRLFPLDSMHKLLMLAAGIANILFLSLVAATAITRLLPIQKSRGIEPRLSALLGTFLCTTLALLPKAELGPVWSVVSTTLILVGASLSFVVLRWLGRSFSIFAEARRLVTEGPYRIVRHPLYLCEGIALLGITLQVLSPLAALIAIAAAMLQYRRMINEEAILKAAFPEYRAYAANTSFLFPTKLVGFLPDQTHRRWFTRSPVSKPLATQTIEQLINNG